MPMPIDNGPRKRPTAMAATAASGNGRQQGRGQVRHTSSILAQASGQGTSRATSTSASTTKRLAQPDHRGRHDQPVAPRESHRGAPCSRLGWPGVRRHFRLARARTATTSAAITDQAQGNTAGTAIDSARSTVPSVGST
jgi:hypothetical protein